MKKQSYKNKINNRNNIFNVKVKLLLISKIFLIRYGIIKYYKLNKLKVIKRKNIISITIS